MFWSLQSAGILQYSPLQNVGPFSNFRGLVHLGSRALIALKFEYVKEEVELHLLYDLHGEV